MKGLLDHPDLTIVSEEILFQIVLRWLHHDEKRLEHADSLLSKIALGDLPLPSLMEALRPSVFTHLRGMSDIIQQMVK